MGMMINTYLFAALLLTTPEGRAVCSVTPPELESSVRLETTNVLGCTAWRLHHEGTGEKTIADEEWLFDFGDDLTCWPVSHAQGEYVPKTLSTIATIKPMPDQYRGDGAGKGRSYEHLIPGSAESPLTIEGKDFTAVIGDAGVLGYSRLRLLSGARKGTVKAVLEGPSTVKLPYTTPWRYVHVAKDCSAIAQNQPVVLKALNAPCRVQDTSWIRPGKVLRVSKLTTACALECVEFAARNGFAHIELDSGWYGDERRCDPLVPGLAPEKLAKGEELDIFKVIAAAKEKGLGTILYVNREPLKKNAAKIFEALQQWGVAGVKYGFVNVGGQKWRAQVIDWIEMCAERHLMVDIHDEFRLTGIQNTYPHVLTVEGIHGNEEMPVARHNAALVYTRFLDGPGDYTPCWKVGRVKNTLAHQLAMPAVYTSGWQFLFWYQRPDQIDEGNRALDFWREIPAEFDEVRHLQGRIGEFAVVARRAGEKWFVGCLNAGEVRAFEVPLSFAAGANAPGAPLRVRLFRDADPASAKNLAPVAVEELSLTAADALRVTAAACGGWAAIVEPEGAPRASGVTVNGETLTAAEWRTFDDGCAVRYVLPGGKRRIAGEDTAWTLPEDAILWYQPGRGGDFIDYEAPYVKCRVGDVPAGQLMAMPVTAKLPDGTYRLLTEANVVDWTDSALVYRGGGKLAIAYYADLRGFNQEGAATTPWRVTLVAKDLQTLATSDIVRRLCPEPPRERAETVAKRFAPPGRSIWHWLPMGDPVLAEQQEWYDRTAALGFEYYLIDEGWRKWGDDTTRWERLKECIDYGRSVGVRTFIWVNSNEMRTAEARRAYLARTAAAGAVGIKIDFIPKANYATMKWYEDTLSDTFAAGLRVDFHGCVKPSGRERTWPHEIAREAVRGHEWHITRYRRILPPEHDTILPFCRLVQGHADYTPLVFNKRELIHFTWARQLAQGIVYSCPFLCFGDYPQNYLNSPALALIKELQAQYDETRILPGSEIGQCVAVAKRKGDKWLIGIENGAEERQIEIDFSFLSKPATCTAFGDSPDGRLDACSNETFAVRPGDRKMLNIRANGGWAAIMEVK